MIHTTITLSARHSDIGAALTALNAQCSTLTPGFSISRVQSTDDGGAFIGNAQRQITAIQDPFQPRALSAPGAAIGIDPEVAVVSAVSAVSEPVATEPRKPRVTKPRAAKQDGSEDPAVALALPEDQDQEAAVQDTAPSACPDAQASVSVADNPETGLAIPTLTDLTALVQSKIPGGHRLTMLDILKRYGAASGKAQPGISSIPEAERNAFKAEIEALKDAA